MSLVLPIDPGAPMTFRVYLHDVTVVPGLLPGLVTFVQVEGFVVGVGVFLLKSGLAIDEVVGVVFTPRPPLLISPFLEIVAVSSVFLGMVCLPYPLGGA